MLRVERVADPKGGGDREEHGHVDAAPRLLKGEAVDADEHVAQQDDQREQLDVSERRHPE